MSAPPETFQVSQQAAEVYEDRFVPALFATWCADVVEIAAPRPGQEVLDVACGTGVVARAVADRLAGDGRVVGLDLNPTMLSVAARASQDVEWRRGDAADLPFAARSFDLVTCQASLMFFPDPLQALREMARVTRPTGVVVVLVPGRFDSSPAYVTLADVVGSHVPGAGDLVRTYFAHGDLAALTGLLADAGLRVETSRTDMHDVVFASIEEFVATEIGATPLAGQVDADTYARLLAEARAALSGYVAADGSSRVPIESHVVRAVPSG